MVIEITDLGSECRALFHARVGPEYPDPGDISSYESYCYSVHEVPEFIRGIVEAVVKRGGGKFRDLEEDR